MTSEAQTGQIDGRYGSEPGWLELFARYQQVEGEEAAPYPVRLMTPCSPLAPTSRPPTVGHAPGN
jgi:hypothetical protein